MSSIEALKALKVAGFSDNQAESLIVHIEKIIDNRVATKADLSEVRSDFRHEFQDVRREIQAVRLELNNEIHSVKHSLILWIVGLNVTMLGLNGAAIWLIRTLASH